MAEVKAVSRVEAIQNGDDIKPFSREEYFLKKSIGQGGGSGGAGYTVETQSVVVIPEQSVVTVKREGQLFASAQINIAEGITYNDIPDTLTITFQGQEYVCSNNSSDSNIKSYGAPIDNSTGEVDFSQYPFALGFTQNSNVLVTESADTYTVKVGAALETVTVTADFAKARGYWKTTTVGDVIIPSQTITTGEPQNPTIAPYNSPIIGLVLEVDGTKYQLNSEQFTAGRNYGVRYTTVPNSPYSLKCTNIGGWGFYGDNMEHTITAYVENAKIETSDEFKQAVKQLQPEGVLNVLYEISINRETREASYVLNAPWSEISTALQNGGARLYSHNYDGYSELTITGTILNAGYSTSQGTKTYTADAIVIQSSAIKLLHFTTTNEDGTGLTATLESQKL